MRAHRTKVLVILAACVLALSRQVMAQGYFDGKGTFGGGGAFGVTADFNGDGIPDVATVGKNTLTIQLGQPDGSLGPPVTYPASPDPTGIAVGGFRSDGKIDIVVTNSSEGTVSVFLGNGDGTFQPSTSYPAGVSPSAVTVADFNNDGKPDLAISNNVLSGTVSILLGNGDGTFQGPVSYAAGVQPVGLTAADFNGDGLPDLAVADSNCPGSTCGQGQVAILLNQGNGTFGTATNFAVGKQPSAIATADFNGDSKIDLAVANSADGTVSILLGNGNGTFQGQVAYAVGVDPVSVFAMDLNGDQKPDLALGVAGGSVGSIFPVACVLLGNGDGTFQAAQTYEALPTSSSSPNPVIAADFNGDGFPDLEIVGNSTVMLNNGKGGFENRTDYAASGLGSIATGDFNGDGIPDLAVVDSATNTVWVYLGQKGGGFLPPAQYATGPMPEGITVGDFNGDGKPDIAVNDVNSISGGATGYVSVLLGNGDGTFQTHIDTAFGLSLGVGSITSADLNGDGKLDVAVTNSGHATDEVLVMFGNGDGTFQSPTTYNVTPATSYLDGIAAANLTGSGLPDLAVAGGAGLEVLLNLGNGTFGTPTGYMIVGPTAPSVAVADFNGDGKLDLAVGQIVFLNVGNGLFQQDPTLPIIPISYAIAGEWNADGKADLAGTGGPNFPTFALQFGNGDGSFGEALAYGSGAAGNAVVSADFNGDGVPDFAFTTTNGLSVLLSSPVMAVAPRSINFGNQQVGTSSPPQTVLFTNPGNAPLAITGIAASGAGFSQTNNCPGTLNSGANCSISVTFDPTAPGNAAGSLTLADSAPTSPQSVALAGIGVNLPAVTLSPNSLNFGNQSVGSSSNAQNILLTNTGLAPLTITGISIAGAGAADFGQTNNCPINGSLQPQGSCTVSVTFKPAATGLIVGSLSVTDNAPGSPQTAPLTGTGTAPVVSLSPTSLAFAGTLVRVSSPIQRVTLTNTGASPLTITRITTTGDFSQGNNCPTTGLASNASCTISVSFSPSQTGTRAGSVVVTDNAANSPQTVSLTGTGQDFSLAIASGSSTSQSVSPGGTATYTINATGLGGLNANVSFACTGAPVRSTCSVSPATVTPGSSATAVTVTVTTQAGSLAAPWFEQGLPPLGGTNTKLMLLALLGMLLLAGLGLAGSKRPAAPGLLNEKRGLRGYTRRRLALPALLLLLALGAGACGGGNGTVTPTTPGTPAGTYNLILTGSAALNNQVVIHNVPLSLTVK